MKRERKVKRKATAAAANDDINKRVALQIETTNSIKAKSKDMSAKAYAQSVVVSSRQAETAELKEHLDLIDRHGTAVLTHEEFNMYKRQYLMQLLNRKTFDDNIADSLERMTSTSRRSAPTLDENTENELPSSD